MIRSVAGERQRRPLPASLQRGLLTSPRAVCIYICYHGPRSCPATTIPLWAPRKFSETVFSAVKWEEDGHIPTCLITGNCFQSFHFLLTPWPKPAWRPQPRTQNGMIPQHLGRTYTVLSTEIETLHLNCPWPP